MVPTSAEEQAAALASRLRGADTFHFAARALAGAGREVEMSVVGNSMGTALPEGTIVRVALCDGRSVLQGDIVVFRQNDGILIHRVVHRAATHLLTRGDARLAPDPPVTFVDVVGSVTNVVASVDDRWRRRRVPRNRLLRAAHAAVVAASIAALHIRPQLAAHLARWFTWLERQA